MQKLFLTLTLIIVTHAYVNLQAGEFTACTNDTTCTSLFYCQPLKDHPAQGVCIPFTYKAPQFQNPTNAEAAGIPANIFNSCIVGSSNNPCHAQIVPEYDGSKRPNLFCREYTQLQSSNTPGICLLPQI